MAGPFTPTPQQPSHKIHVQYPLVVDTIQLDANQVLPRSIIGGLITGSSSDGGEKKWISTMVILVVVVVAVIALV
jgi:hypothetical protein